MRHEENIAQPQDMATRYYDNEIKDPDVENFKPKDHASYELDKADSDVTYLDTEHIPTTDMKKATSGLEKLQESLFNYVRNKFPGQVEAVERVRQEIPKMPFYKRAAIYLGVAALVGSVASAGAIAAGAVATGLGAASFVQGAAAAFGAVAGYKAGEKVSSTIGLNDKLEQVKVESSLRSTIKKAEKMLVKEKVSAEATQHIQSIEELKQINEQLLQQVEAKLQKKFDRQYMLRNITQKLLTAIVAAGGSYGYYNSISAENIGADNIQQNQLTQSSQLHQPDLQTPQQEQDIVDSYYVEMSNHMDDSFEFASVPENPSTETVPDVSQKINEVINVTVNQGDKFIKILNNTFNDLINSVNTISKPLQTDLATLSEEIGRLLGADGNFYSSVFLSDAAKDVLSKLHLVDVDLLHPGQQLDLTKIFTHPDFVSELLDSIDANKYSDPESVKEFVKELYKTLMTQAAGGNLAQAGGRPLSV